MTAPRDRLAFALDYPTLAAARAGAEQVRAHVGVLKVGLELFVAEGPPAARLGAELGCATFLDLKLHDIPETVDRAVASACALGVRYLTVHAAGGPRMLETAAARAAREGTGLTLLAVTVLTSLDGADLERIGVPREPAELALRLGRLALGAGVPGLVCSAAEVGALRAALGPAAVLVTPGIRLAPPPAAGPSPEAGRPSGAAADAPPHPGAAPADDQKRVGTPESAVRAGASVLVVGRPIRDAADPAAAARAIEAAIAGAAARG